MERVAGCGCLTHRRVVYATINEFTDDDVLLAATVADGASNEQLAGSFILSEDALNSLTCFSHTLELGTVSTSLTCMYSRDDD